MRTFRHIMTGLVITTAALAVTGCGESPELKLQRAKIALSTDHPEQALRLAESVLKEQPDNSEAVRYKAISQMRLDKLEEARATLDGLLSKKPDDLEVRKLLTEWGFRRLAELMRQSTFAGSAELQAEYDKVLEQGVQQAEWMETKGKDTAEARFLRGRYAEADALRLTAIARDKRSDPANLSPDTKEPTEIANEAIRQVEAKALARGREASEQMRSALEANPRLFDAAEMYARLLTLQEDWSMLWAMANRLAGEGEIPVSVFERVSLGLMRMPDVIHPTADRLGLARKLQEKVGKTDQQSTAWKVTSARLDLIEKNYSHAGTLLDEVLQANPRDVDGRYLKAQSLYGLEKYADAKAILDKLSTEQARSPLVQALYGLTLVKLNDKVLAKEALRRATELDPANALARGALIQLMAEEGRMKDAKEDVEVFYRNNPGDPSAIRIKMGYEMSNGQVNNVKDLLERVDKVSPRTPELINILVDGYVALKNYPRAERFAAELVRARPDALGSHLALAQVQLLQGRDDEVRTSLAALKEKFPKAGGVDQMLGRLYLQRGSFDKAVELLRNVVKQEPANQGARLSLAQGLMALSLPDEALEQVQVVLDRSPQDVQAHALAARTYQMMGQADKAAEHLQQIDLATVDETSNPTLVAQLNLRQGQLDQAISVANRAVASGNPDPSLRLLLADAYNRKQDYPQVETNLIALVKAQPTNSRAFEMLARFYVATKDIDRGLLSLSNLQPVNEVLSRISQAAVLSAVGRRDEALQRVDPVYAPLIKARSKDALVVADAMASIYVILDQPAKAFAVYEPLNEAKLFPVEVAMRQMQLTSGRDKPDEVLAKLERVVSLLTPEQKMYRRPIVLRYMSIAKYDRALQLIDGWRQADAKDVSLMMLRGEVYSQMGRTKEAIESYNAAMAAEPENVRVRQTLAQAHVEDRDYAGAEAALDEMAKIDDGARIMSLAMKGQMFMELGLLQQATATFEELDRTGKARDPRVIFAMGRAYSGLHQDELAMKRLAEVPAYAPQYAPAQILLARLEQRRGKGDQAKTRLEQLARSPATVYAATHELLALSAKNQQDEELLRWSDQALSIERLPPTARATWLNTRITLQANRRDWTGVAKTLEDLAEIKKDSLSVAAARTVVMLHLRRPEDAQRIFRSQPKLAQAPDAYALAFLLQEKAAKQDLPMADFMIAMASGDPAAARSAAERIKNRRTLFRDDLLSVVNRPDASSPEMSAAFRDLTFAMVALEVGLPQITTEVSQDVINRLPAIVPAYGLMAQSLNDRELPADETLDRLKRAVPNSATALLLSAFDKMRSKDNAGSLADFQALLKREPDNEHLQYNVAQALQRLNNVDQAIPLLQKIYDANGAYKFAAANDLAYLMAVHQPGKLPQAKEIAQTAFKVAPQFTPLLDTVGWIEHLQGNDKQALALLNRALAGLKDVAEVQYHLGVVYQKLGNKTWAGYHLKEALANGDKDAQWRADAEKLLKG
ncbi:MAG: tetratricopeptide repeat protein [Planctomycetes bacterium]|nr:tetratricopeptide repeat protein [Planctomycetota bacterium]